MIYILFLLGDGYKFDADFSINKTFFAVLALLYPLTDLLRVFVLRIKNGQSPFVADQRHLHHYLQTKTKNNFYTLIIIYAFQIIIYLSVIYLI